MASLRDILSGGASGAGTGAAIGSIVPGVGTGVGALVGGGLGLAGSIFGGGDKKRSERRVKRELGQTQGLRDILLNQYQGLSAQAPNQTATYTAGVGSLRDLLRNRTRSDAASAASRGLAGGEFEIAQGAQRNSTAAEFLRNLLGQSEQIQMRRQQSALGGLLDTQSMANRLVTGQQARDDQRRANNQAAVSNAVMNAILASQMPTAGGEA